MRAQKSWSAATGRQRTLCSALIIRSCGFLARAGPQRRCARSPATAPWLGAPHSSSLQRSGSGGTGRDRRHHANPGARERALLDEEGQAELREALCCGPPPSGGMWWSGPKVARWIAQRNGSEKVVHVQRGFGYPRKVGMSPQVPRPSNAQGADDSEREAFKKVPR